MGLSAVKRGTTLDDLYRGIRRTLQFQELLLRDSVRNKAFYQAIKRSVRKGSRVLDIGTGTGIWAVTAVKLGAGEVVAIERNKFLIPVINSFINENSVAGKIKVITGDSRRVKLSGKFDLIICETIGTQAFDENIVPIMSDAVKRFLRPGGIIIPRSISIFAAPARLRWKSGGLPSGIPFKSQFFNSLVDNTPFVISRKENIEILSVPQRLIKIDLKGAKMPLKTDNLSCQWQGVNCSKVNCVVTWVVAELTNKIKIDILRRTSWLPAAYTVSAPFKGRADLEFNISLCGVKTRWTSSFKKHGKVKSQSRTSLSPVILLSG
ncbi:MAG: 50S ribosomal protein L11 methyltransferase [Planctomycetes bacterium]|nr:50S ribosomal protein L11 methyltransferase [Planctomycetota bacterium]